MRKFWSGLGVVVLVSVVSYAIGASPMSSTVKLTCMSDGTMRIDSEVARP